jgi:hypothetical protein
MSWLDKLLGREKKTAGESSMPSEGMQQGPEPGSMPAEGAAAPSQPPQEEQEQPPGRP